jgi:predicted nucleic acid-binding protein
MIVVDASVAVKWLIPEDGNEQARALLRGSEPLVAPSLIRLEVAGAVLRRYRESEIPEEEARAACGFWARLLHMERPRLVPVEEIYDDALDMAFAARHGLGDCLYLAAARRLDARVVTADRKLFERGKRAYERIDLLGHGTH